MKRKFLAVSLFFQVVILNAQDAHYTFFENAPFFINPGSAGMLDQNDYRGSLVTRNQWRKVVKPANSTTISFDMPFLRYTGSTPNSSFLGAGFSYAYSGMGDSKTRQTQVNLTVSGITTVGENKFLGLGLAVGKGGMRSDLTDATWSNQFDGYNYNAALPSNEIYDTRYKARYLDLSAGLNYLAVAKKSGRVTNIGVSYLHGNNPKIKNEPLLTGRIDPRLVFHLRTEINLNFKNTLPIFLIPRVLFSHQGVHNDIQAGISMFVVTNQVSHITTFNVKEGIEAGLMYRHGDAIGILAGYKITDWRFGLTYDITISTFGEPVKRRGGAEISLVYYGINKTMRETRGIYLK